MAFAPDATDKSDQKEVEEASRREINHKVMERCADSISKLIECETHREKFYLFSKCGKQKKELADCCVQFGSDAVLEVMKRKYAQHPKEGKGPAKP